jgi:uncharacterized protein (TIGR00297 family)
VESMIEEMTMQVSLGLLLAGAVAFAGWRLRLLSGSGAVAAAGLGTLVFGLGGWSWAVVLIGFFATSSGLTRLFGRRKRDLEAAFSKGGQRDAGQVLANGGLAGLAVLAHALWPASQAPWLVFCGALAAVNADTWATELGVLSPTAPRLITTFKPVPRGTSGGISAAGTLAALAGALCIGLLGLLFWPDARPVHPDGALAALTLAGLVGSLVDSLLGATFQAIYTCPACARETERHPRHTCGGPTHLLRGQAWLDNDGVNLACALMGGLLALLGGGF